MYVNIFIVMLITIVCICISQRVWKREKEDRCQESWNPWKVFLISSLFLLNQYCCCAAPVWWFGRWMHVHGWLNCHFCDISSNTEFVFSRSNSNTRIHNTQKNGIFRLFSRLCGIFNTLDVDLSHLLFCCFFYICRFFIYIHNNISLRYKFGINVHLFFYKFPCVIHNCRIWNK